MQIPQEMSKAGTVNVEILVRILFSQITFYKKRHICDIKTTKLENDLPTSVKGIFAILEGFYFHETSVSQK